jgi:hypothetical protein
MTHGVTIQNTAAWMVWEVCALVFGVSVTNNNGFWIRWLVLLVLLYSYNQLLQLTINLDRRDLFSICSSFYDSCKSESELFSRQSVLGDKPLDIHDLNFYFPSEHLRLFSLCNILSDEWMGLSFTIVAGLRQGSHSQSESRGTHDHILLSQIRDSPKLEGQVPVFIVFPVDSCKRHSLSPIKLRHGSRTENTLRTPYPSNSSIILEVCLLCRCIETTILSLLVYSLPRESV